MSCHSQIIPVEDYRNYPHDIPDGAYIKDVNNILDKYVGTWEGNNQGKHYEFFIIEETTNFLEITSDELWITYRITDNTTGNILVDTTSPFIDSWLIIKGKYFMLNAEIYVLSYLGLESNCGQNGDVHIAIQQGNENLMKLVLHPYGEVYYPNCPDGSVYQVLPTGNGILLERQ